MKNKLSHEEYSKGPFYRDMILYKEWDDTGQNRTGIFDGANLRVSTEELADFLTNYGFELKNYNKEKNYEGLTKDINELKNELIVNIDIIVEEKKALLTFFDNSRELVNIKNLE